MPVAEKPKTTYQEVIKQAGKPVAKFFSNGTLKALPLDAGDPLAKPVIRFVVSTTTVDLVGDVMSEQAIDEMLGQALGKSFFVNHSYNIPQDVLGVIVGAFKELADLTDPLTNEPGQFLQLVFDVRVAMSNPVAVKTYELVKEDEIKLGASVSIIINESHTGANGTNIIDSIFFLECSAVGIPANQASWVQQVSKAFKEFEEVQKKTAQPRPAPGDKAATKKAAKPAAQPKDTKKMSKKSKRLVRKNAFDEIMSGHASATIADLTQALANAVGEILSNADGGNTEGVPDALKELFSDFEEACMTAIQPAVDAMEQETPEDEEDEDSDGLPDDQEDKDAVDGDGEDDQDQDGDGSDDEDDEEDDDEEDAQKSLALEKVRAFLKMAFSATKKSRKASKDGAEDLVTTMDEDGNPYQDMHNYCVQKGAACKEIDTPDADGISLSYRGAKAAKQLQTRVKELETENAQWEAIATEMREKLANYLRQPLPAGKK